MSAWSKVKTESKTNLRIQIVSREGKEGRRMTEPRKRHTETMSVWQQGLDRPKRGSNSAALQRVQITTEPLLQRCPVQSSSTVASYPATASSTLSFASGCNNSPISVLSARISLARRSETCISSLMSCSASSGTSTDCTKPDTPPDTPAAATSRSSVDRLRRSWER